MTPGGQDHAWALAQLLERMLLNARGAMRQTDPRMSDMEFRAALLKATAYVIAEIAPPTEDVARQAEAFGRILTDHMRGQQGRGLQLTLTERALAAYDGPERA